MIRAILVAPIRAYQRWFSPLLPPRCRFLPTCSQYAVEAIETHGAVKGLTLAAWRVLRCQPFCEGGLDPVPRRAGPRADGAPPSHD